MERSELLGARPVDPKAAPEAPAAGVPLPEGAVILPAPQPLERGRAYIVRTTEPPSHELSLALQAFMRSTGVQLLVLGPDVTIEAAPE